MIDFFKMHACGNDYIYIDETDKKITNAPMLAERLSKRRFSIGGDGLVIIGRASLADGKMTMYNADGSMGRMCGNALRCVAKYLYDKKGTTCEHIYVETLDGVKTCTVKGEYVTAKLRARKTVLSVPESISKCDFIEKTVCVNVGNEHLVCVLKDLNETKNIFDNRLIEGLFEEFGVNLPYNVEFVKIDGDKKVSARVFERGSGETYACGTGACAVAYSLRQKSVCVKMRGGELSVENLGNGEVLLGGIVNYAFKGVVDDEY